MSRQTHFPRNTRRNKQDTTKFVLFEARARWSFASTGPLGIALAIFASSARRENHGEKIIAQQSSWKCQNGAGSLLVLFAFVPHPVVDLLDGEPGAAADHLLLGLRRIGVAQIVAVPVVDVVLEGWRGR